MTAYEKPALSLPEAERFLEDHYSAPVEKVTPVDGGNLSRVFFFDIGGEGRVLRFSDLPQGFALQHVMSERLRSQGVNYQRFLEYGTFGTLTYSIAERIEGTMLINAPEGVQRDLLPAVAERITRLNRVEIGDSHGYGWVQTDGSGSYPTWRDYLVDFFGDNQTGTFWENWTDLFRTSVLEREVFDECYARLMAYSKYNEPYRFLVHNDSHPWNLLTDGRTLTGLLDGNFIYGDFLIDLTIVERSLPSLPVTATFRAEYEKQGLLLPDFEERLIGAHYYKGLDGLRFFAKMGWTPAYEHTRDYLLSLVKG
ncbi:phosphotransferase [Paenibacillus aurantius]|uniref:Phosphotransferase n=1 Tax=Paenibacillus aurantius TaxID=2918900 RepID=A0AA96LCM5_9BACL|nr:phosphotransferase [Paenibacillus aurantius]WNQ10623.1 phosphotransferase [Paenibacillus aurantius]